MEIRQFLYAIQIAEEKNFSRAAEKLHLAQPSLSQQISKLEKEIGVRLFERNTNSVQLTYAGSLFVEKSQKILDMIEQLNQEMDDISQTRKGRLIVGSLPMTGSHILPLVLPAFKKRYPHIDIVLVEETTAQLEQLTASGQTDICLLSLPIEEAALVHEPIIEEEICIAVPPDHPLSRRSGPVDLQELEDEPFIVLKKGQGFRHIAIRLCQEAGFMPRVQFESSNIETVQSLVAAGMGIAFVPSMVVRQQSSDFAPRYLTIQGKPSRTLVIAYRKGRYLSNAADAFIRTLHETVKHVSF